MDKKQHFGSLLEQDFSIGDIVEWTTFDKTQQEWLTSYGIITTIDKEISSGRLISVSKVMPISGIQSEIKFFTASLRLVSRTNDLND